ncbi:hypothetical protein MMC12_005742 [Toensbergia leucococca]|nr:hypothetical protein [Toensbergia leucococca]
MPSLQTLNTAVKIALPLISLAGFLSTWGLGARDGFLGLLADRLHSKVQLLPAAEQPVRMTFTGLPLVDPLLQRLTIFLWPAIDGTWPGTSLVAFEFSGQFAGAWMVAGLEGLRLGNKGKLLTFTTIVGLLSQTITFCTILPLYFFLHLLTSPTNLSPSRTSPNSAATDLLVDPIEVAAWPIAFTLSYLIPTALVALPTPFYTSYPTCQIIMAFWELYPIPFKIFQVLLIRYFLTLRPASPSPTQSPSQRCAQALTGLRTVYLFSATFGAITHIITLTLSLSTIFFPTLFTPIARANLSPTAIFVGVSPLSTIHVNDMGQGLKNLLIWNMNISAVSPLLWAALQYRNAHEGRAKWEGWTVPLLKVAGLTAVGGSASGVAALMWARDEMVLGAGGETEESKKFI